MRVLVAYDSKHGATAGIAERIAATIARSGHEVTIRPVAEAGDPADFDAVVLGCAVYFAHWLKDAKAYVDRHREALASRPTWLFSSGPLGTARVDENGVDLAEAAVPEELPALVESLRPQEHKVFYGALDPKRLALAQKALRTLPAGRALLPEGDFREWPEVEQWATRIATQLQDSMS